MNLDAAELDKTIEKLEQIKKLLEDIDRLAKNMPDSWPSIQPTVPVQPTPMPYFPQPSRTWDPPWTPPYKIWCKADTEKYGITCSEL